MILVQSPDLSTGVFVTLLSPVRVNPERSECGWSTVCKLH